MSDENYAEPVVAIIGGGFSGAAVAFHLAQASEAAIGRIVVFEPREKLGAGLAYDTRDPAHRINVPASRMSLLPNEPEQFLRWIEENGGVAGDLEAERPDGQLFPRRRVFGDYVNAMVSPFVQSGRIVQVRSLVTEVEREESHWLIKAENGNRLTADILVLATSHPAPAAPRSLAAALGDHPRFVADPTRPGALDVIGRNDRLLIVGNGLTSADVVASLAIPGHRGHITAISRRGLRSRGHPSFPQEPFGDFVSRSFQRATDLLRTVRSSIRQAEAAGLTWHAVIDQVRTQGQDLWRSLPVSERRRIVRHLRPYWDVHRFRVAPQVENVLKEALSEGRLEILAASVVSVAVENGEVRCLLRPRYSSTPIERHFDAVVVTTGPAHLGILSSQRWIGDLAERGYLSLDAAGLGLACNEQSEALGSSGAVAPSLYIAGPLARGTFGELMGLPQVSEHALFVAARVLDRAGELSKAA
ncbi:MULTISPECIES: FAD/NAD(P)-binding protein [unclassified Sinorhizobium]|uniref:FAD/NAD(P)-binding protein n=1 Tax=unclassified Sinorhizobium TaxID=2613772 RepID=UPI0035246275